MVVDIRKCDEDCCAAAGAVQHGERECSCECHEPCEEGCDVMGCENSGAHARFPFGASTPACDTRCGETTSECIVAEGGCAKDNTDRIAALEAELAEERDSTSRRISSAEGLRVIAAVPDVDHDTAANIAQLTGLVAELNTDRDRWIERHADRVAERDEARDAFHDMEKRLNEARSGLAAANERAAAASAEFGRVGTLAADKLRDERAAHAATTAKLGRAIRMLRAVVNHIGHVAKTGEMCTDDVCISCRIETVIADSKAAGDYVTALEAVYVTWRRREIDDDGYERFLAALAAVDARRGVK